MLFKNKMTGTIKDGDMQQAIAKPKRRLSIRSKYLLTLLFFTLMSVMTIAYIAWYNAKESLIKSSYDQLTTLRNVRVQDVERFFNDNKSHLKILSENETIVNAMDKFNVAYDLLNLYETSINKKQSRQINDFYENNFYPNLSSTESFINNIHKNIITNNTASYLQYHYIVNNGNKQQKKDQLIKADDKSYYSEIHGVYHEKLRFIVDGLHLDDLFLINKNTGDIIYSTEKNVDFATNLLNGTYVDSGLAKAVRRLMRTPDRKSIIIQDLQPYIPDYNKPVTFMVIPIYKGNKNIGILGVKLSMDVINSIMTHNKQWLNDGLGESGEVYLLSDDFLMRSDSRLLLENKVDFLKKLQQRGEKSVVLKNIDKFNTTIFNKSVNNPSSQAALEGKVGYKIIDNYYGLKVLSAYAPVSIKGLNWVVLAEKSLQEVRKPIVSLQLVIMISTVILIILVSIFSLLYSYFFLQPIYTMVNSAREFTKNNTYSQVKINSSDELGTLTYYFNKLISHSRDQHLALEQENNKRKRLMLNFFPPYIVEKMEKGETNMAHNHDNVALLFASFRGLNELIDTDKENNNNNNKNMENLSKLFNSFDAMAKRYEVDKLTLFGNNYVATCGLHKPRIDYARRCVHFSLELFNLVQRFNQEKNANLRLRIGINSGSVTAGIVGKEHFSYGLWGDTISIANRILYDAHADSLRITHKVYEQLTIKEYFQQCPLIHLDTIGEVSTWEYKAECDENGVCKILLPTKNIKDYESSATNHRVTENV